MKNSNQTQLPRRIAFTLIELLVVIAIIGVLAALVFPALKAAKITATRGKVQTELKQLEAAIEAYKAKFGFYPPDNPGRPELNQLFYELHGMTQKGTTLETLDGQEQIQITSVPVVLGAGVAGFVNFTREGGADDSRAAQKFLNALRSDQYAIVPGGVRFKILVCPVPWPARLGNGVLGVPELNPWRYNSSSPTHNSKTYDLWVDVELGGKTNRISNWNRHYEVVK